MISKLLSLSIFILFFTFSTQAQVFKNRQAQDIIPNAEKVWVNAQDNTIKYVKFSRPESIAASQHSPWLVSTLKLNNRTSFNLARKTNDKLGQSHYRYQQLHNGIRVEGGVYLIHSRASSVLAINGEYLEVSNVPQAASLNEKAAFSQAKKSVPSTQYEWEANNTNPSQGELVYIKADNGFRLAYKFDVYSYQPLARYYVFIDANNGEEIAKHDRIHHADVEATAHTKYHGTQSIITDSISASSYTLYDEGRSVETLDLNNGSSYSSAVDFTNSSTIWNTTTNQDDAALDAHFGAEKTHEYFNDIHGLDSYDGDGASINSYVHYGYNYVNAFWDGSRMTYGDGDSFEYTALTSLDVVGHEITHAVTEYSAGLIYSYQSGALNESFSDIFGVVIDYYADPVHANWYMGDLFHLLGNGFRDMSDPNNEGHPDTYLGDYWNFGSSDNGGVHTNSGVQNFWFYLLTEGGIGTNDNDDDYLVTAIGMDDAAAIAYRNLSVYLVSNSNYDDARFYAIESAIDLFGSCSVQEIATTNAWYAVGVGSLYENAVLSGFTATPTHACEIPASISFNNLSLNDSSRVWDFGDGTTDSTFSPTHIYTTEGNWTVTLITYGSTDCGSISDTLVYENYITTTNTGGPEIACIPTLTTGNDNYGIFNVTFNTIDHSTDGADEGYQDYSCSQNTLVTAGDYVDLSINTGGYSWHYVKVFIDSDDDGVFDSSEEVFSDYAYENHTGSIQIPEATSYDSPLRMRVIADGNEIIGSCTTSIYYAQVEDYSITIAEVTDPPVADFEADQTLINATSTINFSDLSNALPTSWEWSFPGGSPSSSTEQNPAVTYNIVGDYDVQLIVSNAIGSDTLLKSDYIAVTNSFNLCGAVDETSATTGLLYDSGGPTGSYSNNENCYLLIEPGCADSIILSFNAFQLEGCCDYFRAYDGNSTSGTLLMSSNGGSIPPPVVATSGSMYIWFHSDYSVTYSGFEATWTTSQFSTEAPVADFSISNVNPPLDVPILFTDESSNEPNSWFWDFGDGTYSDLENPSHSYITSGSKTITLIVNTCSESDTISYDLIVQDAPIISINPTSISHTFESCVDSITFPITVYNTGSGDLVLNAANESLGNDSLQSLINYTINGASTIHDFTGIPASVDTVHVTINLNGNYENYNEYAALSIDNVDFGIIPDYYASIVSYEIDLFGEQLEGFLADGGLSFIIDNSYDVGTSTAYLNSHEVIIEYTYQSFIYPDYPDQTIAIGDSSVINVSISAAGFLPGTYVDSLAILSNDINNNPIYLAITMINNGTGDLDLSVNCLAFDTLLQFSMDSLFVEIFNAGCGVLEMTSLSTSNDAYSLSFSEMDIDAFSSDTLWVYFSPTTTGAINDSIQILSNVLDTTICLSGIAVGAPIIDVNPDSIDVTITNCGDSLVVPLMIYNNGLSDLDFSIPNGGGSGSGNTLNVVAWNYGADLSREYPNTIDAIDVYFNDYTLVESATTSPSVLEGLLANANVLLIAEQENYVGNVNVLMSPVVQDFVNNGGWLIRCGAGKAYMNDIGIFYSLDGELNNMNMTVEDADSPLLNGVTLPIEGYNAVVLHDFTTANLNVVASSYLDYTAIASLDYGSGKAIYIGYDFWAYGDDASRIIGNAMEWASMFSAPWIDISLDSGSVVMGDSTLIYVTISSEGLFAGDYSSEIIINSNDPANPTVIVPVNLHLSGEAEIDFSTPCVAFDSIMQFTSDTVMVQVFNMGCDTLAITDITSNHDFVFTDTTMLSIAPLDSASLTVYFFPDSVGSIGGELTFSSNIGDTTLCFEGNSFGAPIIEVNPDSIAVSIFSCNDSITVPITIYNTGLDDLDFMIPSSGGGSGPTLNVLAWTHGVDMSSSGEYNNTIDAINEYFTDYNLVESNAQYASILTALLADADVLLIPEQEFPTNSVLLLMASTIQDFVNDGGWLIQCGTDDNNLNNLGIFSALNSAYYSSGYQNIENPDSPLLTGLGTTVDNYEATYCIQFSNSEYNSVSSNSIYSALGEMNYGSGKAIYIAYDFYEYGDDASLIIGNAFNWASQSMANWISVDVSNGSVAPGDSIVVNATISSEGLNSGDYTSTILIYSNDPTNPNLIIPVSLHVEGGAEISFSSDCVDFEDIMQFSTDTSMITIYNNGCEELLISDIISSNDGIAFDSTYFSIMPHDSLAFTIYFTPDSAINYLGDITFESNVGDSSICFTANGLGAPLINVDPTSIEVSLSCNDSIVVPVTIYNDGLSDLEYIISGQGSSNGSTLNVVSWTYGSDLSQEYPNTIDAINVYFTDYTLVESNTTTPSVLEGLLADADVLLIAEQEGSVGNVNFLMSTAVQDFVSNGGWLIRCGAGKAYLNDIGIFYSLDGELNSMTMTIEDEDSPLLDDVSFPLSGFNATVLHDFTTPGLNVVASSFWDYTAIASLDYGEGKAIYIGFDYYAYGDNASRIIGNAFEWAQESLVNWTYASPLTGTIASGDSSIVYITISSEGLLPGEYTMNYTFNSNDPLFPDLEFPVTLTVTESPCIAFDYDISDVCSGTVSFNNTTTGNADSYEWDFGDGGTSTLENPFHNYDFPGYYLVSLIASNANGSDTLTQEIFIIFYNTTFIYSGFQNINQDIQFVQTGSTAISWIWFFGDGMTANIANPIHQYTDPGEYVVTLTTESADGCIDVFTDTLVIEGTIGIQNNAVVDFAVYPNPNFGSFTIQYNGDGDELAIELTNKVGQIVYADKKYMSGNDEIKIENLDVAPGIYILHLSDDSHETTLKLIID